MDIFDKYGQLESRRGQLLQAGADPFSVRIDRVISPTLGIVDGRETILIGTNNYLGLTMDAACIQAAVDAVQKEGTGTTGSRIANGTYQLHKILEAEFARFFDKPHAMVFTTGYQANLATISGLAGAKDYILADSDNHASIWDGCRLAHGETVVFRHNDPDHLDKRLTRLADKGECKLIVVEGLYSMLGDTAPIAEFVEVKKRHGAFLLVDEAHSFGIYGPTGRGVAEAQGVDQEVDFIVGTFSKSLAGIGGFAVSNHPKFDLLRLCAKPYMFTASPNPSSMASVTQALREIAGPTGTQRAKLGQLRAVACRAARGGLQGRLRGRSDRGCGHAGRKGRDLRLEPVDRRRGLLQLRRTARHTRRGLPASLQRFLSPQFRADRSGRGPVRQDQKGTRSDDRQCRLGGRPPPAGRRHEALEALGELAKLQCIVNPPLHKGMGIDGAFGHIFEPVEKRTGENADKKRAPRVAADPVRCLVRKTGKLPDPVGSLPNALAATHPIVRQAAGQGGAPERFLMGTERLEAGPNQCRDPFSNRQGRQIGIGNRRFHSPIQPAVQPFDQALAVLRKQTPGGRMIDTGIVGSLQQRLTRPAVERRVHQRRIENGVLGFGSSILRIAHRKAPDWGHPTDLALCPPHASIRPIARSRD